MENDGQTHKRRQRYAGKYPRRFEEKYKELNPEKYGEIIEHVKKKGNTPAGTHISIMVQEILQFFQIQEGQKGLDCTFGYGGHTLEMLRKLNHTGHMTALDVDPVESSRSKERLSALGFTEDDLSVVLTNFSEIDRVAAEHGPFDFILADLGVSSMQIDDPSRGFSYKTDGPLDLRMNQQAGKPASERLRELDYDEIVGMLQENADEPYAEAIAKTICSFYKAGYPIETTKELRTVIESALRFLPEKERKEVVKKSCTRTFQALRIDVNHEYEALDALLQKLPDALLPGGKVAILTFHSGEDRLVKQAFKQGVRDGRYAEAARDVIRPGAEECTMNPRSRSTKMRWAIKAQE